MARPFQLEAVLTHRGYRVDTARQRLADAARELGAARQVLQAQEHERAEYRRALRLKQNASGSVQEILIYTRYLNRLDGEINCQRQVVKDLYGKKEALRRELMTRLKERKVIERLKERHLAEVEEKARVREQKMLSDVAISRYQRRQE
jgi:flagellar FliJ protein